MPRRARASRPTRARLAADDAPRPSTAAAAPSRCRRSAAAASRGARPPRAAPTRDRAAPHAPPRRRRRRKRRRRVAGRLIVLVAVAPVGGGWLATRAVYFVGIDPRDGARSRSSAACPYELPLGIELYRATTRSGVTLEPSRRRAARRSPTTSCARSDDAEDLVSQLERGQHRALSARNRELLALVPASLLLTAGFAAIFIQQSRAALGRLADLRRDLPRAVPRRRTS